MKKILIGYDDTEPSKRALLRGAEIAKAMGADVHVTSGAPGVARSGRASAESGPNVVREVTCREVHTDVLGRKPDEIAAVDPDRCRVRIRVAGVERRQNLKAAPHAAYARHGPDEIANDAGSAMPFQERA